MIREPKFEQTVEDNIHMLHKNESTKGKKHVSGKKNVFQGEFGFFPRAFLRGMLPSMVTLPLFHLHFLNGINFVSN